MTRRAPEDRHHKTDSGKRVAVGLAMVKMGDGFAECTCGHPFKQRRIKVREDAIQKHFDKRHQGRGIII